ncbi:hypothetical protein LJB71_04650 [Thermomonas sp. S9]|uniref:hypothetical protein n=1 Tax=Thermomonas sp. S9 TaxID=2885203 RepID=UPI00216AD51F|nr:hypothetical protein [Thermomonas sp. S9]MCR6495588.1 hypothetical protein [Thermomonas sp. S9]
MAVLVRNVRAAVVALLDAVTTRVQALLDPFATRIHALIDAISTILCRCAADAKQCGQSDECCA